MSKTNSAAAVYSISEFAKRFNLNSQDLIKECCEFLAKLRVSPADAGVIKDSSGGMIWFSKDGIQKLNSYSQAQGLASGSQRNPANANLSPKSSRNNFKPNPIISAVKIQRFWRAYHQRRLKNELKSNSSKRHERKDSQTKISQRTKEHVMKLSLEYTLMTQNPLPEKELQFIKFLNSPETFQASITLSSDSFSQNLTTSTTTSNLNPSYSTIIQYQKSSVKFLEWINKILYTKFQTLGNPIEILKNGNILCQIIIKLFPATDCLLLEKGKEYSIHKIIFFLEFCRCLGIMDVFKVLDLIPSLIKDESVAGIAVLKTIYNLENRSRIISNWKGPFLELNFSNSSTIEQSQNKQPVTLENRKRSSVLGQYEIEKMDSSDSLNPKDEEIQNIQNVKKDVSSRPISSMPMSQGPSHLKKGPLARLKESRAKRTSSWSFPSKGAEKNVKFLDTNEDESSKEFSNLNQQPPAKQNFSEVNGNRHSTHISANNAAIKKEAAGKSIDDVYSALESEFGNLAHSSNDSNDSNEESAPKAPQKTYEDPSRDRYRDSKIPVPLRTGISRKSSFDTLEHDTDQIPLHRPEPPKPAYDLKNPSNLRDSFDSVESDLDKTPGEKRRTDINQKVHFQLNSESNDESIQLNNEESIPRLALKISSDERLFSTIMAHIVELLDILTKKREIEIRRIGIKPEEIKSQPVRQSFNTSLFKLLMDEKQNDEESDLNYLLRIQDELKEISQYREIALSIMALHRRLNKSLKTAIEEFQSQDNNSDRLFIADFFMNFANDMITPYIRFAVIFFDSKPINLDKEFIQPSNPSDKEFVVDFIKRIIKTEEINFKKVEHEHWERFFKYPLQRLYNYSHTFDNLISFSKRSSLDTENRNLFELVSKANTFTVSKESIVKSCPSPTVGLYLKCEETEIGLVKPDAIEYLIQYSTVFKLDPDRTSLILSPDLDTPTSRTLAIQKVFLDLKSRNVFTCLNGWRNEKFQIFGLDGVLFEMERSAIGLLGVRAAGCHLNGYVCMPDDGSIKMWIGKRSLTKQTYPGLLDNIVGGGLTAGLNPRQCILKECLEEASIPSSIADNVVLTGTVSFFLESYRGWLPNLEYCYDLKLPLDFVPKPEDGEVYEFKLLELDKVKELLLEDQFTPESGLVVLDFLVRHGYVTAENEADYLDISLGLHRSLPFPSARYL